MNNDANEKAITPEGSVHPVDLRPPMSRLLLLGGQHMIIFYATVITAPAIIAAGAGLSRAETQILLSTYVLAGGIGTIIQSMGIWKIGIRYPLILGVSAVAFGPTIAIANVNGGGASGLLTVFGALIASGIVIFLIAPLFGKLIRLFPPIVIGSIITMVGFSIIPIGVLLAGGGLPSDPTFGNPVNLIIVASTIITVLLLYRFTNGLLKNTAMLWGLIVGSLVGLALGAIDTQAIADAPWFGFVAPFTFGLPRFQVSSILVMVLVMLIIVVESVSSYFAVGEVVGRAPSSQDITRGVRAEGLGAILGGLFSALPPTTYNANIGLVRASGIKSRWITGVAGVFMILVSCVPKVAAVAAALPLAAIGGVLIILFGMLAAIGIQMLRSVDLSEDRNLILVTASFGAGMIPVSYPQFFQHLPSQVQMVLNSGIVVTALVAITLNVVFNRTRGAMDHVSPGETSPTPDDVEMTLDSTGAGGAAPGSSAQ